jgi:hypothetical protein
MTGTGALSAPRWPAARKTLFERMAEAQRTTEPRVYQPGERVVLIERDGDRTYATFVAYDPEPGVVVIEVDGRYYNPQRHLASSIQPALAARDMVIGDLLNLAMLKEAIEVEFLGTLWTEGDSGMLTPYVCECSFGDGLKLLTISTINQRPNYHVVRVDSSWQESNWSLDGEVVAEHIDDILQAIEEECGPAGELLDDPCDDCGDTACKCSEDYSADAAFPALDDRDGCLWGHIRWPWLMKEIGYAAMIERLCEVADA